MGLSPAPVGSAPIPVSVRIELKYRTPIWCPQRIGEWLGVETHIFGDRSVRRRKTAFPFICFK